MEINFVLYRSKATQTITKKTSLDIAAVSTRCNLNEGITGFLHIYQDHFLQYIEGPRGPLLRKLASIRKDRRHYNFSILAEGVLEERFFPDWNMGQISEEDLVSSGAMYDTAWLRPNPDLNPMPLLLAFAAHAGLRNEIAIDED